MTKRTEMKKPKLKVQSFYSVCSLQKNRIFFSTFLYKWWITSTGIQEVLHYVKAIENNKIKLREIKKKNVCPCTNEEGNITILEKQDFLRIIYAAQIKSRKK